MCSWCYLLWVVAVISICGISPILNAIPTLNVCTLLTDAKVYFALDFRRAWFGRVRIRLDWRWPAFTTLVFATGRKRLPCYLRQVTFPDRVGKRTFALALGPWLLFMLIPGFLSGSYRPTHPRAYQIIQRLSSIAKKKPPLEVGGQRSGLTWYGKKSVGFERKPHRHKQLAGLGLGSQRGFWVRSFPISITRRFFLSPV